MITEGIWISKKIYDDAESNYYENLSKVRKFLKKLKL